MYSRCVQCGHDLHLNASDLRKTRGMVRCPNCNALFDALITISDQPINAPPNPAPEATTAFLQTPKPRRQRRFWLASTTLALVLLLTQAIYFEGYTLTQQPELRPWLASSCHFLGCQLPEYKNIDEISILTNKLESIEPSGYRFTLSLINQSPFRQLYPSVKLSIMDFTGNVFATRTFSTHEYHAPGSFLAAQQNAEIILDIAAPKQKIGGYHFSLL